MNNQRRAMIQKAQDCIDRAKGLLEEVVGEEAEAFDNLPDSIQESERGERMEEVIDLIKEIVDDLDDIECCRLEDVKQ